MREEWRTSHPEPSSRAAASRRSSARGGMGVIYRATELRLGRPVALKLIAAEGASDPALRERFEREARLTASIDHPNVIPVYAAGEEDGHLYLVMRFVPGTDLHRLLRREGRLAPARAARVVAQVADALDAAHAAGLVHRDVKPANVLIADEHVYLSDFGITRVQEADTPDHRQRRLGRDGRLHVARAPAGRADRRPQRRLRARLRALHGADRGAAVPPPDRPRDDHRPPARPAAEAVGDAGRAGRLRRRRRPRAGQGPRRTATPRPATSGAPRSPRRRARRPRRPAAAWPSGRRRRSARPRRRSRASRTPRGSPRSPRPRSPTTARARPAAAAGAASASAAGAAGANGGRARGATARERDVRVHRGRRRRMVGMLTSLVLALPALAVIVLVTRSGGTPTGPLSDSEVGDIAQSFASAYTHEDERALRRLLTPEARRVGTGDVQNGRPAVVGEYRRQFDADAVTSYKLADMTVTGGRVGRVGGALHGAAPRPGHADGPARARGRALARGAADRPHRHRAAGLSGPAFRWVSTGRARRVRTAQEGGEIPAACSLCLHMGGEVSTRPTSTSWARIGRTRFASFPSPSSPPAPRDTRRPSGTPRSLSSCARRAPGPSCRGRPPRRSRGRSRRPAGRREAAGRRSRRRAGRRPSARGR